MCWIKFKPDPEGDFSIPARPVAGRPPPRSPGRSPLASGQQYITTEERTPRVSARSFQVVETVERSPRGSRYSMRGAPPPLRLTQERSPHTSAGFLPPPEPYRSLPRAEAPIPLPDPIQSPYEIPPPAPEVPPMRAPPSAARSNGARGGSVRGERSRSRQRAPSIPPSPQSPRIPTSPRGSASNVEGRTSTRSVAGSMSRQESRHSDRNRRSAAENRRDASADGHARRRAEDAPSRSRSQRRSTLYLEEPRRSENTLRMSEERVAYAEDGSRRKKEYHYR